MYNSEILIDMIQAFIRRMPTVLLCAASLGSAVVYAAETDTDFSLAKMGATAHFIHPKDGATVHNPVRMRFSVNGMKLVPAGQKLKDSGHHHVLIDGQPVPAGEVIQANDRSIHYGKAQQEAELTLPPGDHTLTLQFGDWLHRSYGPAMSQTIKVHVKDDQAGMKPAD